MSVVLLVWDAPNVDMSLSETIGRRPDASTRPRFDAVGRWLVGEAERLDAEAEAAIFVNVPAEGARTMTPFVHTMRTLGFSVFAKPKLAPGDDIDDELCGHVLHRLEEGHLAAVYVASMDGRAVGEPLRAVAGAGVPATVLGFAEFGGWVEPVPGVEFLDLEDLPGVFDPPLERETLFRLPPEGRWLRPLGPLGR